MKPLRTALTAISLTAICCLLAAQKRPSEDSIFRLVSAERAQQTTIGAINYRIVKGNARFLHNDTYLLCDSAAWNVDARIIEAFGNVKVIQDETMLTSDEMIYLIDEDVARFSGPLVELTDKDGNKLRTRRLDYNTKDSTAVFERGAAMKDKDGNIIESTRGTYDSKEKTFVFEDQVRIFMDTLFMKMDRMDYLSKENKAIFGPNTFAWMEDGFIHSDAGYYDRKDSVVNFSNTVYMNDPTYEAWAEDVYYYRQSNKVEMFDNVRILDTADLLVLFGNHGIYEKDSSRATMTREPAVVYYGENENHEVDTLFLRADTVVFWGTPMCDFTKDQVEAAQKHRADALFDALLELRTKQAEERAKNLEERMRAAGKLPPLKDSSGAAADSLSNNIGSLSVENTAAPQDTTPQIDSTLVKQLRAWNNAKVYRTDVQFCCDSLEFTELDSIMVLYGKPILWNKVKNQLTSETMHLLFRNGSLHRGSMLTDARITSMEDTLHFNQIRSTEMMGFFAENQLYRFDALGGVSAVFYMQEKHEISNVNLKQAKSLTAVIEGNTAKRMLYLDEIKSDAYPLGEIEMDKQRLKGFEWRPDERPVDRFVITDMSMPESSRAEFEDEDRPNYIQADRYFDKYMQNIYKFLRDEDIAKMRMREEEKRIKDSLRVADSLAMLDLPVADTVATVPAVDTAVVAVVDTAVVVTEPTVDTLPVSPKDLKIAPDEVVVKDSLRVAPGIKTEQPANVADNDAPVVEQPKKMTRAEKRAMRKARRAARKAEREARKAAKKAAKIPDPPTVDDPDPAPLP